MPGNKRKAQASKSLFLNTHRLRHSKAVQPEQTNKTSLKLPFISMITVIVPSYAIYCGIVYLLGYWPPFNIKPFEHIAVSDIISYAIYPFTIWMFVLFFVLILTSPLVIYILWIMKGGLDWLETKTSEQIRSDIETFIKKNGKLLAAIFPIVLWVLLNILAQLATSLPIIYSEIQSWINHKKRLL